MVASKGYLQDTSQELEQLKKKTEDTYRSKRKSDCLYEGLEKGIAIVSKKDPAALVSLAKRVSNAKVQNAALHAAVAGFLKELDFDAAVSATEDLLDDERNDWLRKIIYRAIETENLTDAHSLLEEPGVFDKAELSEFYEMIVDKFIEIGGGDYRIEDVIVDARNCPSCDSAIRDIAEFLAKAGRLKELEAEDVDSEIANIAVDLTRFLKKEADLDYLVKIVVDSGQKKLESLEKMVVTLIDSTKMAWAIKIVQAMKKLPEHENSLAEAFVKICRYFITHDHTSSVLTIAKYICDLDEEGLDKDKDTFIKEIIRDLTRKGHKDVARKVEKLLDAASE